MTVNLSKSKIMAGLQCPKRLYFQVYNSDLAGELDDASRAVIEQGEEVGRLARTMFPGGLLIETGDELDLGKAMELTSAAVFATITSGCYIWNRSSESNASEQLHRLPLAEMIMVWTASISSARNAISTCFNSSAPIRRGCSNKHSSG